MPAFVQSYSQSQAKLMFITTLGMDNFDCTKMNAHFKNIHSLSTGGAHSQVEASIHSPLPLMSPNNSQLCSTHNHFLDTET